MTKAPLPPAFRLLRVSTLAAVAFLIISTLFLVGEHRMHYLGALPYYLLFVVLLLFCWLLAEHRREHDCLRALREKELRADNDEGKE